VPRHKTENKKELELFGQRVRYYRVQRRWSQEALAFAAGLTHQQVSFYELGKGSPSFDKFITMCKELGVGPDDLLGFADWGSGTVIDSPLLGG